MSGSLWVKMGDEDERTEFFMWRKQRNRSLLARMTVPAGATRLAHEVSDIWVEPKPTAPAGPVMRLVSPGRLLYSPPGAADAPPWI